LYFTKIVQTFVTYDPVKSRVGSIPDPENHLHMKKYKEDEPVVIYTGISWEAELIKNILENEGIAAYVNQEHIGTLAPFFTTPGPGSVKLVVAGRDAEKALQLVKEFEKDRFNEGKE
jgi:hypothetical protein